MVVKTERSRKLPSGGTNVGPVREAHGRAPGETTTNLKPSSRYVAKDLFEVGCVPLLQSTLLHHRHAGRGSLTVRGCAVAESVQQKRNADQRVVHPDEKPFSAINGIAGAKGNLAPLGAVVKVVGMAGLKIAEPARFDGEEARFRTVKNKKYREGEVLVIRNERPQPGPGMREALAIRNAVALLFGRLFSTIIFSESGAGTIRAGGTDEPCHAPF
jgi:dihydroxyacid dehydratase/phosphogluconate dehydratase